MNISPAKSTPMLESSLTVVLLVTLSSVDGLLMAGLFAGLLSWSSTMTTVNVDLLLDFSTRLDWMETMFTVL